MGYARAATPEAADEMPPKNVVGICVSQNYPEATRIREKLEEGIERLGPDAVWVMRETPRKNHACSVAWAVLREHGIEPIHAAPHPIYGREWADAEMRRGCARILVFHDGRSLTTASWKDYYWWPETYVEGKLPCRARIFVIERGKPEKKRKGRKRVEA